MNPRPISNISVITWDFRIAEQNHVARYGHSGSEYFKQYLPFGIETPDKHPPQRILQRQYDMAKRLASPAAGSTA